MKMFRLAMVLLALAVMLSLATMASAAEGEINTNPVAATYITDQVTSIGANTSLWYRFDYSGGNTAITIKLPNGNNSGMGFKVYTADQAASWWDTDPVGQGTPDGNDLLWVGNFNLAGSYYVEVLNDKPYGDKFQLLIAGEDVALGSQPAQAGTTTTAPAGTAAAVAAPNIDPFRAATIDAQVHSIPASSSLWYRFDYAAGDHPLVTRTLHNATNSGVHFNVYTAEASQTWWDSDPVGRGTASLVSCQGEMCPSNDLTWVGSFNLNGTYYVQVVNDNANPVSFELTIQ